MSGDMHKAVFGNESLFDSERTYREKSTGAVRRTAAAVEQLVLVAMDVLAISNTYTVMC